MKAGDLRTTNMLGALALTLMDRVQAEIRSMADQGETDCAALVTIQQRSGLSIEALGGILGLSQPGTVRLVDRLVEEGLVARQPGANRRTRALVLTEKGRLRTRTILFGRERALGRAIDALPAQQRSALAKSLETMLAALTTSRDEAWASCRFCDEAVCPGETCPTKRAAAG